MTTIPPSSTRRPQSQSTPMPDSQTPPHPASVPKPLILDSSSESDSLMAAPIPELSSPPSWHYEAAVVKVEGIIHQIETGDLELAEVFDQFAIAVQQLHECEVFLQRHRQHVDILVETLTDEPGAGA